ncbi:calcium homeostasis modulator protein 6-like [Styela clava]
MVVSMGGIGSIFTSVQNTVKTSSGSAINIVICLVTVGSEQLFSFAAFNCPCPEHGMNETSIPVQQNYLYGWVFILVPAFALFILGYAMNIKTWKLMTGCCRRSSKAARGYGAGCVTILEVYVQAMVAPLAWMSVAFLDGKYFACAVSKDPYKNNCDDVLTRKLTTTTAEFEANKRKSQIIGWCLIAFTLFLGSIFYMIHRCLSPLTYHHRKYARWYRELESDAFEKKAKEQIREEVEKETVARFLQKKRNKDHWDKISTVFNFTRDKYNYALYSRLDEWNEKNKSEKLLGSDVTKPPVNDVMSSEDESSLETTTTPKPQEKRKVPGKVEKCVGNNMEMKQIIPKISPPPGNKNAGKRRLSSSGIEDNCSFTTSRQTPDMTSRQTPDTTSRQTSDMTSRQTPDMTSDTAALELAAHQKQVMPPSYGSNDMTSQGAHLLTPQHTEASIYDNDVAHNTGVTEQRYNSMPDIYTKTKSTLKNGKVHIKSASKEPFLEDDDDVTS